MRIATLLTTLLLLTGCYDRGFDEGGNPASPPAVTTHIAALHALHRGELTPIESRVVVSGRVTANTQGGNFYRSILLEAEGAAIEVLVGLDALHNDYPIGAEVVLNAEGLVVERAYGILRIGIRARNNPQALDYLASKATADQHLFRTSEPLLAPTPHPCTLDELSPAMAGRLCRIEGLQHAPEQPSENRWAGEQRFIDNAGRTLYTYTRNYADLAEEPLPEGRCTLIGIVQYDASGEGRYLLKLRNEADIQ